MTRPHDASHDKPAGLLIPPKRRDPLGGVIGLHPKARLDVADACPAAVARLADAMAAIKPPPHASTHDGPMIDVVHATLDPSVTGIDGFRVKISQAGIDLRGNTPAAVGYALHTLAELVEQSTHGRLACEQIDDHADFARRAAYLDCARGKIPHLATVCRTIDRLASWRYNEVQLYIEAGFAFQRHPKISEGLDPFTAQDLREIQAHAAKRHVRLVGSLASFGHMEWILSLPEYLPLGELPGHWGLPGGCTLCPTDPGSIRLMRELYEEFVPLFESGDFNICCDETWEIGQGRSADRAKEVDIAGLYIDFVKQLHQTITGDHGKRVNLWADIALKHPDRLSEFPDDVVMLNWEYNGESDRTRDRFAQGKLIREHGYPLMVCPGSNVWMTHGGHWERALWNVRHFVAAGREQGAEGVLMTDWGDAGHRNAPVISLLPLAYAAAHAWHGEAIDDQAFINHFCRSVLKQADRRFPAALRELATPPAEKRWSLYHGLVEPPTGWSPAYDDLPPATPCRMGLGCREEWTDASRDELERVVARPDDMPGLAPDPDDSPASWTQQLRFAWDMDRLAARKMLHDRHGVTADDLPDRLHDAADRLAEVWRAEHRDCRLSDNLHLIRSAAESCKLTIA